MLLVKVSPVASGCYRVEYGLIGINAVFCFVPLLERFPMATSDTAMANYCANIAKKIKIGDVVDCFTWIVNASVETENGSQHLKADAQTILDWMGRKSWTADLLEKKGKGKVAFAIDRVQNASKKVKDKDTQKNKVEDANFSGSAFVIYFTNGKLKRVTEG